MGLSYLNKSDACNKLLRLLRRLLREPLIRFKNKMHGLDIVGVHLDQQQQQQRRRGPAANARPAPKSRTWTSRS